MVQRIAALVALSLLMPGVATSEPLPSWNDTASRARIIEFVAAVTDPDSAGFVPVEERIAVFDNDGTLWSEQPAYFQLFYAMDFVRRHAAEYPAWRDEQPFRAVLENDMDALLASGEKGIVELVMASHAGMTSEEFDASVKAFFAASRHPSKKRRYDELVYQPMLELLVYLRANGFQTWIVSGGGIDFVRAFAEDAYGIPPEQVVGSQIEMAYELVGGKPTIVRQPAINFIDDKAGKPVGIARHIGRKPIAAFGNSDGDLQMLQYTCIGRPGTLCGIVHHTDAKREWAYGKGSHIGGLDAALAEARQRNWTVIDMAGDWKVVYPFEAVFE